MDTPDNQSNQALTKADFFTFIELSKTARLDDMKDIKNSFYEIVVQSLSDMKKQHETAVSNLEKRIAELKAIIKKQHTKELLDPKVRDGILRKRRKHARGRNLVD